MTRGSEINGRRENKVIGEREKSRMVAGKIN